MNIKKVALQRLVDQHGWIADLLGIFVTTQYPTAVGLKQASAHITEDAAYAQFWLKAEYQSEGRNALSTCIACIPAAAQLEEVHVHVDAFVAQANKTVAETYAARLLAVFGIAA